MSLTDAGNHPVRRPSAELHSADVPLVQKPNVTDMGDVADQAIIVSPGSLTKDYEEALAFAEEPVTIRIEPIVLGGGNDRKTQPMVDCWVNGKGAEVVMNGRWVELRFIPVGVPVTTKRKYVEVIARSKRDAINTVVTKHEHDETNEIERYTSSASPFQIIKDANPKGVEWFRRLMQFGS